MPEVMNTNMEKNFFTYVLENPNQFNKVENYFFKNEHIQFIYSIIKQEYLQSKKKNVPSPQQIVDMVKLNDPENKIPNEVIKILIKNDISDKRDWLEPRFRAWKSSELAKNHVSKTIDEMRNIQGIDFENTKLIISKIRNLWNEIPLVEENDEDLGDDFDDPETHRQDMSKYRVPSGWASVDKILGGGWDMGTFNVLMGETNVGKCSTSETLIRIRNKKTREIQEMTIGNFFHLMKNKKS